MKITRPKYLEISVRLLWSEGQKLLGFKIFSVVSIVAVGIRTGLYSLAFGYTSVPCEMAVYMDNKMEDILNRDYFLSIEIMCRYL